MKNPKNSIPMVGGQGPFDYITMGGMFTVLKVREGITNYEDPSWYKHPPGTVAEIAPDEDLKRDGIQLPASEKTSALNPAEPLVRRLAENHPVGTQRCYCAHHFALKTPQD